MRYASVCSGIEAPTAAWRALGWTPVFFSEIEKFPCRVLAHHYPDVPNLGDMTRINGVDWRGKVDVLIGGTPCQAFSVAGQRKSLADDRGNLSLVFCELVHAINPLAVVWENVPGVLSVKDNAFGCFLAGLVGEESGPFVSRNGSWPVAGVVVGPRRSAAWRVLDAQYFGLAQRRRRVFVVSFRTGDGINPGAVLLEFESLPRHSPPRRETGAGVAGAVTNRIDRGGVNSEGHDGHLVASALDAHMGMGGPDDNAAQANHLVPAPHADISPAIKARDGKGPSSDGDGDGDGAILVPMVAHSLRADGFDASEDGTGRGTPLVPVVFDTTQITPPSNYSAPKAGDACHPLAAGSHPPTITYFSARVARNSHTSNQVGIKDDNLSDALSTDGPGAVAYAIQERAVSENVNAGPQGSGINRDIGYTLEARHHVQAVAYRTSGNCGVMEQGDKTASLGTHTDPNEQIVHAAYGVRRLTPRECERLQGFPDDYTAIPGAKDGPRYKALGNSMAVPVITWIGRRIQMVVDAHAKRGVA